jgi:hypothetical protein
MGLFGKKDEELPEILRGKTPEQVAAAMLGAEEATAKIKDLETRYNSREAELGAVNSTLTSLQDAFNALDARTKPTERKTEPPKWEEDAPAAFREGVAPIVQQTAITSATLSRMQDENNINSDPFHAAILKKYKSEVDDWYNRTRLVERTMPGCYQNVFSLVAGRHVQDINRMAQDKDSGFLPASGGATPPQPSDTGGNGVLSEEQKLVCERLGISEDDYRKQQTTAKTRPMLLKSALGR